MGTGKFNQLRAEYILRAMQFLHYDAINLGEKDILIGPDLLLQLQKKYQLPLISANIIYIDSQKQFVEPYIIKRVKIEAKNMTIGIFGVTMAAENLNSVKETPMLMASDPIVAAKAVVAQIRKKCDVIIALSHLGTSDSQQLASSVPGIDLIISGHGYAFNPEPAVINNSIIVQGRNKGQALNWVLLTLDKKKQIQSHVAKVIELDDQFADHPDILKLISEYQIERNKIVNP
ncbi:hypothetical protein L0128_19705 [candidate division KSB1 bacterium]|nr:hypothetical protein [candidate division KSB1 bacterium]